MGSGSPTVFGHGKQATDLMLFQKIDVASEPFLTNGYAIWRDGDVVLVGLVSGFPLID